ncbi:MAG: ABC-type transporter, periplasmic subunit, partial [Chloroflexi bacterium]|nr:ABC-type transporter, periplasmic subunit [Chloroflexota bacterium]
MMGSGRRQPRGPLSAGLLGIMLLAAACSSGSAGPTLARGGAAESSSAVKRVVAAILSDPPTLRNTINTRGASGSVPGVDAVEGLLHSGLVAGDHRDLFHARMAEAVPSLENGLWNVLPDGRMDTTWKIRPNARWHDGTPFTAADLIFTQTVAIDPELGVFREPAFVLISSIDAPDPQTAIIRWTKPYIAADGLFATSTDAAPLPRHLLERSYL